MVWFLISLGTTFAYGALTFVLFYPDYMTEKFQMRDALKKSKHARWMAFALMLCSLALTVYLWIYPFETHAP